MKFKFNKLLITLISLFTISTSIPFLITSCASNSENTNNSIFKEVIASDNETKVSISTNTYQLANPFDEPAKSEFKKFDSTVDVVLLAGNSNATNATLPPQTGVLFFTSNDFLNLSKLIKVNNNSLTNPRAPTEQETQNGAMIYFSYSSNEKEVCSFLLKTPVYNFETKLLSGSLIVQAQLESGTDNLGYPTYTDLWTGDLGSFTFTNAF